MIIYIFNKKQNIKMVIDVDSICQILILSMSIQMPLYEALRLCINAIKYDKFKNEFEKFVNSYILYNFNMSKAIDEFSDKFNCYEFKLLLGILNQIESNGNIIENLEYLSKIIELSYQKFLKYIQTINSVYVGISLVLSLIDIMMIIIYPLFSQISQNLNLVFM